MEKWLLIVESNCADPDREQDFNEWYNNTHLPDMLELSSVIRATRYENMNPGDGEAKYVALYEVESEDFQETLNEIARHLEEKTKQGRMSDLLQVTRRLRVKQIFSKEK